MSSKDRREREKNDLRLRIMDAARQLFADEGYEAVSMRRIADAIEYSPTAIYVHFKDKLDLMSQICKADFALLAAETAELMNMADPIARIALMGRAYVRFGLANPNHYRLMFMARVEYPPNLIETADPALGGYAHLRSTCQQAIEQERIRPEYRDVELLTQTVWAAVHGVTSIHIARHDDPCIPWVPLEQRISAMIDGILRGLCVDGAVSSMSSGGKEVSV